MHSTYLINKLPSVVLGWKTPHDLLYKKQPKYDEIKCFGCLCFATIVKPKRDKFALGFVQGQKGYKLFDVEEEKVLVSRHVIFKEKIFPFEEGKIFKKGLQEVPLPIVTTDQDQLLEDYERFDSQNEEIRGEEREVEAQVNVDNRPEAFSSGDDGQRHIGRVRKKPAWLSGYVCHCDTRIKEAADREKVSYKP